MRKNVIPTYFKILFLICCMFIGIKSANSAELNNPFPEVYKDTIALTFVRMGIENGSDIIPFNICHFSCPVSGSSLRGKLGSFKAPRGRKSHEGIDMVDRFSSISGHHEVRAILPGKVIYADFNGKKEDDGYGHTIIIDHLIGLYSLYAHLTSNKIIREGSFIESDAVIGYFANELRNKLELVKFLVEIIKWRSISFTIKPQPLVWNSLHLLCL
ncbi:MAG: M23 family metallopeptidase [Nitrospinae bacterium]|nr:M23 family metallopeptidase [Nitrospinota bacterium]